MSAAVQAALIERPQYLEARVAPETAEESVRNLVHELRQPLSSIEAIAYYLEMTLPAEQAQARQYMRTIQDLVAQASSLLHSAAAPIRKPCGSARI
jgi:nitrogen-specific signal transduction histidine kinase